MRAIFVIIGLVLGVWALTLLTHWWTDLPSEPYRPKVNLQVEAFGGARVE